MARPSLSPHPFSVKKPDLNSFTRFLTKFNRKLRYRFKVAKCGLTLVLVSCMTLGKCHKTTLREVHNPQNNASGLWLPRHALFPSSLINVHSLITATLWPILLTYTLTMDRNKRPSSYTVALFNPTPPHLRPLHTCAALRLSDWLSTPRIYTYTKPGTFCPSWWYVT